MLLVIGVVGLLSGLVVEALAGLERAVGRALGRCHCRDVIAAVRTFYGGTSESHPLHRPSLPRSQWCTWSNTTV